MSSLFNNIFLLSLKMKPHRFASQFFGCLFDYGTRLKNKIIQHLTVGLLLSLSVSNPGFAEELKIDTNKSRVLISFKQMGVPVSASFKQFQARLNYNAAKPELSHAKVEIDMRSLELPAPEYNQEVLKKEWFHASQFPKAHFESLSMKLISPSQLEVNGVLTIKGQKQAVRFPISIKPDGKQLSFEGSLQIKRLHFSIGEGEWKDTSLLADEVSIQFKILTQ